MRGGDGARRVERARRRADGGAPDGRGPQRELHDRVGHHRDGADGDRHRGDAAAVRLPAHLLPGARRHDGARLPAAVRRAARLRAQLRLPRRRHAARVRRAALLARLRLRALLRLPAAEGAEHVARNELLLAGRRGRGARLPPPRAPRLPLPARHRADARAGRHRRRVAGAAAGGCGRHPVRAGRHALRRAGRVVRLRDGARRADARVRRRDVGQRRERRRVALRARHRRLHGRRLGGVDAGRDARRRSLSRAGRYHRQPRQRHRHPGADLRAQAVPAEQVREGDEGRQAVAALVHPRRRPQR